MKVPTKIPINSEKITFLVTKANTIATNGGSSVKAPYVIELSFASAANKAIGNIAISRIVLKNLLKIILCKKFYT